MAYFEAKAKNGQEIIAHEMDFLASLTYQMMGYNPDDKPVAIEVFSAEDPGPNATLEESAPLHQEFTDSLDEAKDRVEEIIALIDGGTFEYNPPVIPGL